MMLNIDLDLEKPLYLQISEQIQNQILTGVLPAGMRLPSVRALGDQLGVNFNTVARAYRHLDQLGWLRARQGRGAFVHEGNRAVPDPMQYQDRLKRLVDAILIRAREMGFEDEMLLAALIERLKA